MRLNVLLDLQFRNVLITFLFSIKYSYLVMPKITPDVNDYLWSFHVVQDLGDSLHVRHNF